MQPATLTHNAEPPLTKTNDAHPKKEKPALIREQANQPKPSDTNSIFDNAFLLLYVVLLHQVFLVVSLDALSISQIAPE